MSDVFPRRFGKYTLLEPLAQGGMGALYLACQGEPGMEKLCVVKTVLRELADKEYVARFRDEAKVVVRLSHGNLVPVFDAGNVAGELYIVMDYVDGRDLRAVWNQCAKKGIAFPLDVAVFLVKELARGLYHAHTSGDLQLVHRDVSPPNVLLAYSGEVRLTDFGLASSTLKMERTAPGVIYGKVSYMSPEQARGEPLDGRADLYAAGVILWELLTGRQLFPNSEGDALDRVRNPQIVRPSQKASRVPTALDALVMRSLAPSRDDRYADGEEMRAALAGWLAREAPTIDNARVAAFLRELFEGEIERERRRREQLIEDARRILAQPGVARGPSPPLVLDQPAQSDPVYQHDAEDQSAGVLGQLVDGRYRVNRLIGEGGMGRVYEAEHVEIGKRVAMKVLHPAYSRFPEVVARFRREARAASRIGHPNIVDVTDSGTTATGAVYFVMEYLEGCDLADIIQRERALATERAVHIAVQLCRALEAAHAVNVIHRDLKPENIYLVARSGQADFVKVLDFGIARQIEMEVAHPKLTKPNVAMGTPEYMAPEQAAGKPADARADIYAAGAILYEMLTGTSPHHGENAMEVLNKKATETPPPVDQLRPDVSPQLSAVIARALARNPADRQQTMGELAEELERARPDRRRPGSLGRVPSVEPAAAKPPAPTPAPTPPPPAPTPRKVPPAAWIAGGAAALVIVGGIVWRVATKPPEVVVPLKGPNANGGKDPRDPTAGKTSPTTPVAPVRPPARDAGAVAVSPTAPNAQKKNGTTPVAPPTKPPPQPADLKRFLDEGYHHLDAHQTGRATQAFQKCIDGKYKLGPAYLGLARVAFEEGRWNDAVTQGERAVKNNGGADAHYWLGNAYYKVNRYADAAKQYREVLKLKPNHTEAKSRLEIAQKKAGA